MKRRGSRLLGIATVLVLATWISIPGTTSATMDIQKQAKAAGVDAKTCQTCHVDKLPKKDGPHESNDLGKWLTAEKEKRHAKEVDGAWAKDYPGNKR